jgi:hypothetical protein
MRFSGRSLLHLVLAGVLAVSASAAQRQLAKSPWILSAKTVFFINETGSYEVGQKALAQLKKWGKYQIVLDSKQANLIFVLSRDPYKGEILYSGGQTGTIDDGQITKDPVPNYGTLAPSPYAYLAVIDVKTGSTLWSDSHVWGGLLTGFNSVGERLIKELESDTKK